MPSQCVCTHISRVLSSPLLGSLSLPQRLIKLAYYSPNYSKACASQLPPLLGPFRINQAAHN